MERLTEILAKKQPHFRKISPTCAISDALCRMSAQHSDYLIVTDEDENFLGLLTEHDVATKTIFTKRSLAKTRVKEIMNNSLPFADFNDSVEQCMRVMRLHNARYLPVFSNLDFIGVISIDDILEEVVCHGLDFFDGGEKII